VAALIDEHDDEQDPLLKFSLADAQLKFSVHGDERGLTVPARGPGRKLHSQTARPPAGVLRCA
jgi:hypothetical protein